MSKLSTTQTRIAHLGKPRVIIIGGGFGGLEVVKGLLRKTETQTVLFDKYNHHTFQPLLYQVATSALETSSIVFRSESDLPVPKNFFSDWARLRK